MGFAEISASAVLKFSVPEQEFNFVDKCFPNEEHRARYSVIIGHLYLETELNEILKKIGEKNNNQAMEWANRLMFMNKINSLFFYGYLKPHLYEKLKKINEVRNALAHKLWPASVTFNNKSISEDEGIQEVRKAILEARDELQGIEI